MSVTGKTRVLGVWGHPVSHSRSPAMHNAALAVLGLDWIYVPFDVSPENIKDAVAGLRAMALIGVNVTVPLKEAVLPFLDWADDDAARIGSVNTIVNDDGVLRGYSTDGTGFLAALEAEGQKTEDRDVYLWGAGGSARAVAFALAARGNRLTIANRTEERATELTARVNCFYPETARTAPWSEKSSSCDLFVNTTSLGMTPNIAASPPVSFESDAFVFDLIYQPPETLLLKTARLKGCQTCNGLKMLTHQGALSLSLWAGIPSSQIPVSAMELAARNESI